MLIFNKFTVSGRLVFLTILMWYLVFTMGCSTNTVPWPQDKTHRLSEVGQNKTVPLVLVEF